MGGLEGLGLVGLFIGSFLASTIVPFSSDVLFIGILATGISPVACLIVATIGNWFGGITSYAVGHIGKWEWIEKWFHVKEETLVKQKENISKYGPPLGLVSWLPIVGDLFAIGMGFYRINFWKCSIYMLIGRFLRFLVWFLLFQEYGEQVLNMFK